MYERRNKILEDELNTLKHLRGHRAEKEIGPISEGKLTKAIAEDLSLRYINLLKTYIDIKDLNREDSLIEELCQKLIEYGVTPKGIIDLHLKAVPQVGTIGGLETKRIIVETRMVLLAVMTKYASLLKRKS